MCFENVKITKKKNRPCCVTCIGIQCHVSDASYCSMQDAIKGKVKNYHNIKLFRTGYKLHTAIVHNNLIVLDPWVVLGHFSARLQKQSISQLHDIGFVHSCDRLSVIQVSIFKSIFRNSLRAELCDHLAVHIKRISIPVQTT